MRHATGVQPWIRPGRAQGSGVFDERVVARRMAAPPSARNARATHTVHTGVAIGMQLAVLKGRQRARSFVAAAAWTLRCASALHECMTIQAGAIQAITGG